MDLYAYTQIEDLEKLMAVNNISVPRLRGLRLMRDETPLTKEDVDRVALNIGLQCCEMAVHEYFVWNAMSAEYSEATERLCNKYLYKDSEGSLAGIRWNNIHGKKRKRFKYLMKAAKKAVEKSYAIFNQFCGRDDVLYIHARIGGWNWPDYRHEVEHEPWFITKIDDPFDDTYCDIYARIKPVGKSSVIEPGMEPILMRETEDGTLERA